MKAQKFYRTSRGPSGDGISASLTPTSIWDFLPRYFYDQGTRRTSGIRKNKIPVAVLHDAYIAGKVDFRG